MKRAFYDHNLRIFYSLIRAVSSRDLYGCFIRFGARVAKEYFLHARQLGEFGGQSFLL